MPGRFGSSFQILFRISAAFFWLARVLSVLSALAFSAEIEHRGLPIVRVALMHLIHRFFVGDCTSLMVELVVVAIEGGYRCDVIRFPRRLHRGGHRLGYCLEPAFRAAGDGGYQSGYQLLIAMPQ